MRASMWAPPFIANRLLSYILPLYRLHDYVSPLYANRHAALPSSYYTPTFLSSKDLDRDFVDNRGTVDVIRYRYFSG